MIRKLFVYYIYVIISILTKFQGLRLKSENFVFLFR
jgi:hypothetical protein